MCPSCRAGLYPWSHAPGCTWKPEEQRPRKNTGKGYVPTHHRVKVLYSVELSPAELRALWTHDHKRQPFAIRPALSHARRVLEEQGRAELMRRAGVR